MQAKPAKYTYQSDSPEIEERLSSITAKLSALYPKLIDLSLERIERFLHELGDPHLVLPPVFHVAGTNGKGSVIAILRACLEASEKSVHATISPHLIAFNERIVLAGKEIKTDELLALLDECGEVNAGAPITYFEVATAATLLAFSRYRADFCLIETGLGGRLDATNVIPSPAASIITSIGYDHMDFLGESLTAIATEKAGIMKKGCPCVVAPQSLQALREGVNDVFIKKAEEVGAKLYLYGRDWFFEETPLGFRLIHGDRIEDYPFPNLAGRHQIENAATSIMALRAAEHCLKTVFLVDDLKKGITQIKHRGRLEQIEDEAILGKLPAGSELYLDGAHNENGAMALALQLKKWRKQNGRPIHLITGMLKRKNPVTFMDYLAPHIDSVTCIPVPGEDSGYDIGDLGSLLKNTFPDLKISTAPDFNTAVNQIGKTTDRPITAICAGSLYLIGDILKKLA